MAIRNILVFPHPNLRKQAEPVIEVNDEVRALVSDMFETMYAAPGIGLAATQVDDHRQIIVMDLSEDKNEPLVFINPEIIEAEGEEPHEEGCLSVPGFYETIIRAAFINVHAVNEKGESFNLEAQGLLAVCIQHEIDHLKGKVFVDYISALKRDRIRKKLQKSIR